MFFTAFQCLSQSGTTNCGIYTVPGRENKTLVQNGEVERLQQKMTEARNNGDLSTIESIQTQIDEITGNSVTLNAEKVNAEFVTLNGISDAADSISFNTITTSPNILALATCTEQRGPHLGRIWAIVAVSGNPNKIWYYYSDDGVVWHIEGYINCPGVVVVSYDQMDAEVIVNNAGREFIWVVFGVKNAGDWRVMGSILDIGGANQTLYYLNWPGTSLGDYYYNPRICTDNSFYVDIPYIYFICDYDSTVTNGYKSGAKVAICHGSFTTSPSFVYRGACALGALTYQRPYHYDIAFFRNNGQDSILIVESSLADSNSIYLGTSPVSGYTTNTIFIGNLGQTSEAKSDAYTASNGIYNRLMVVSREGNSNTLRNLAYYVSTNGSDGWTKGYIDNRPENKSRPDIVGKWNEPGTFYCSYSILNFYPGGFYDTVYSAKCVNYNWQPLTGPKNNANSTNGADCKAGFLMTSSGDECMTIWSGASSGVYSTKGCSPYPIGVTNNHRNIPDKFSLYQNYPKSL